MHTNCAFYQPFADHGVVCWMWLIAEREWIEESRGDNMVSGAVQIADATGCVATGGPDVSKFN